MSIPSEVEDFLMTDAPTAVLGYKGSDGRPLVAPVWFLVDDGELVFNTMRDSAKGRALAREPRVALCVDDPHPPFSFVQIQGVVTTTEDHHQLLDTATRIAARYMGPNRADEFGQRNAAPGGVVRVRPTKVVAAFKLQERKR